MQRIFIMCVDFNMIRFKNKLIQGNNMKHRNYIPYTLFIIILLFFGCGKDDPVSHQSEPTVLTLGTSDVTETSAIGGGEVIDDGGSEITARGVVWSTSANPTIDDNKTNDGTGMGSFTSNITGLESNTRYYIRAYATNAAGTAYGGELPFTTKPFFYNISGRILENGSGLANVTISITGDFEQTVTTDADGGYSIVNIPGRSNVTLTPGLEGYSFIPQFYSIESLDQDEVGLDFTGFRAITDIDGNAYPIVQIGDRWWMAENLRTTRYRNGDEIPAGLNNTSWQNTISGAYAVYPHNDIDGIDSVDDMLIAYGALYNWYAVDDSRGLCPAGWRVPGDDDWKQLEMYLGMTQEEANNTDWRGTTEGGKLKSVRTEPDPHPRWSSPNDGATNQSRFNGYPGGRRLLNGTFGNIEVLGAWWTSTDDGLGSAWRRYLGYHTSSVSRGHYNKQGGFSIRCIED